MAHAISFRCFISLSKLIQIGFSVHYFQSCDASILLDTTKAQKSDKTSQRNFGMRNFKYIETIKEALENEYHHVQSPCTFSIQAKLNKRLMRSGTPTPGASTPRSDRSVKEVNHGDSIDFKG
ncbi:hypothetical protein RND71_003984 [Anisodus tanguticus]|uniref:Plant heme peroxidase family profile domain-containing protein n=1 Tax=Anisodus tanguticus TaxID=243964 RepID=A0AAE1SXT2_9SOLA|nr:hypothetical protein RND71_003984 [Anisodus tanguticus]